MEEIQNELKDIKRMLNDVNSQMQELREAIRGAPFPTQMLPMPQPYEHPWWQYQRSGPVIGRNYQWSQVQASGSINLDETGSTVSGAAKAA
jgi:hypothetical protein